MAFTVAVRMGRALNRFTLLCTAIGSTNHVLNLCMLACEAVGSALLLMAEGLAAFRALQFVAAPI